MKKKSHNSKSSKLVMAAATALLAASTVVKVLPPPSHDVSNILAPSTVEAGALTLLKVQGTDVVWRIFPEIPMEVYGDNDSFMATSFSQPGEYLVVASYLDEDGNVVVRSAHVNASSPEPTRAPPISVRPVAPESPVVSIVEPPQVIEPEPDPMADTIFPGASGKVEQACRKSKIPLDQVKGLAANFKSIADRIDAGEFENGGQVVRETAKLNRAISTVNKATTQIQLMISTNRHTGKMKELVDYADLWTQISEGLTSYAESQEEE